MLTKKSFIFLALILACCLSVHGSHAATIDFEAFIDNTPLSNEISGLTFSGGTVLTAGVTLNELDFPPHSGQNVLAALDGFLTISFTDPVASFSAYSSFGEQLSIAGFNSVGVSLFSFLSPVSSNLGSNGLYTFTGLGLSLVTISTNGFSGFTLDDLSFTESAPVPEPSTVVLTATALGLLGFLRKLFRA